MGRLTERQNIFAQKIVEGMTQAEAYRAAYPKSRAWKLDTAREMACRLIAQRPQVEERIRELRAQAAEKTTMTAADVLNIAFRLVRFDVRKLFDVDGSLKPVHELDDDTAAALQSIEVLEKFESGRDGKELVGLVKKYHAADKNAALDKLFKHFGLYEKDRQQQANPMLEFLAGINATIIGPKTK